MPTRILFFPLLLLLLLTISSSSSHRLDNRKPDPSQFLVYGPGLDTRKLLPARYVFVQLRDANGEIMEDYLPQAEAHNSELQMELTVDGRGVRYYGETLKLNAMGLYLLRFRLREPVTDAKLSITYFGISVAQSPYRLRGDANMDECDCPNFTLDEWLDYYNCDTNHSQIVDDFQRFDEIHMPSVQEEVNRRFTNTGAYAFCRYIIKNNELHRSCFGQHTDFTIISDPMILSLMRKMRLPDLDFILNLGDWPLSILQKGMKDLPIISWCGSDRTADIVLPTYDIIESTNSMLDRVYTDVFRVMHDSLHHNWEDKIEKVFFRGRDSNERRLELVRKSLREPQNIDARLTNMFFFEKTADLGEVVKHVPMADFFRYKYQINIDGTVAAYRLPYLLSGGSTVLKQKSEYYEHFYKQLQPNQHFIPLEEDLSDLDEKLTWLRQRDSQAKSIAEQGRQFVMEQLLPESIICYQASVLKQYSLRLSSRVVVPPDFVPVKKTAASKCKCQPPSRDEL